MLTTEIVNKAIDVDKILRRWIWFFIINMFYSDIRIRHLFPKSVDKNQILSTTFENCHQNGCGHIKMSKTYPQSFQFFFNLIFCHRRFNFYIWEIRLLSRFDFSCQTLTWFCFTWCWRWNCWWRRRGIIRSWLFIIRFVVCWNNGCSRFRGQ